MACTGAVAPPELQQVGDLESRFISSHVSLQRTELGISSVGD